jgi:hypothetical protein
MTLNDQKEQFSFAYARAVAATARISVVEATVDDDSVDLTFQQKAGGGTVRSPRVEAQLKCTECANLHQDHVAFRLDLKNYEELRTTDLLVPRILIVVLVPDDLTTWIDHSEDELAMRKCGYWLSLRAMPPTTVTGDKVTVHLPRTNQFNVTGLQAIMQRIGNGGLP